MFYMIHTANDDIRAHPKGRNRDRSDYEISRRRGV